MFVQIKVLVYSQQETLPTVNRTKKPRFNGAAPISVSVALGNATTFVVKR